VSEDDFAHDFNGHTGSRGIGCGVSAQVMRPQMDPDHFTGFIHNQPGSCICNRKYPIIGAVTNLNGVLAEPIGHFLWNENNLMFLGYFFFEWAF
jgi:hypothetical protein